MNWPLFAKLLWLPPFSQLFFLWPISGSRTLHNLFCLASKTPGLRLSSSTQILYSGQVTRLDRTESGVTERGEAVPWLFFWHTFFVQDFKGHVCTSKVKKGNALFTKMLSKISVRLVLWSSSFLKCFAPYNLLNCPSCTYKRIPLREQCLLRSLCTKTKQKGVDLIQILRLLTLFSLCLPPPPFIFLSR